MLRPLLTTFFFLFLFLYSSAQESSYTIPNTTFLRTIREPRFDGCEIVEYSGNSLKLIDFKTSNFRNYGQILMVRKGELYIFISATGMLYASNDPVNKDSLRFERIDKTEHFGYNINCKAFMHKDKIYNIGGYGFWRWNGQLRVFDERSADWKIERLNREIPVVLGPPGQLLWKSPQRNQFVSLGYIVGRQTEKVPENERVKVIDTVISLDLDKTDWKVLGKLNPALAEFSKTEYAIISVLDSGLLVNQLEHVQYLNLISNKIYTLSDKLTWNFFSSPRTDRVGWYKNGYYYFTILNNWGVDSIKLSAQHFTYTGQQIYENTSQPIGSKGILAGSVIALMALTGFWLYKKRKPILRQKASAVASPETTVVRSPYPVKDVFEEIEKALLKLLVDNIHTKNSRTATEEVNRVLGVASKSGDMQKRKRSDVIRSINSKYKMLMPEKEVQLIDRVKSDLDARLFEYYIAATELPFIEAHLA